MANLTIFRDPRRGPMTLREAMDRLFEESVVRPATGQGWRGGLALDVMEDDDNVIVKAEAPGMAPEDIDITIQDDVLSIRGEYKEEKADEGKHYHHREIRTGSFERRIALPRAVNSDKAEAEFKDGILTLTLPKLEDIKPRRVKVRAT